MNYVVKIQADDQVVTYTDLEGSVEAARSNAILRFQKDYPDGVVVDSFVMPEEAYFGGHKCRDDDGGGCCSVCGGAITGSWLDRDAHGGD